MVLSCFNMPNDRIQPETHLTERDEMFPAILRRAGKNACFAADEFFSAQISNPHTRRAYARAAGRFLAWCEAHGIELGQVTPGDAGRFIGELAHAVPTQNQALAALRKFFDVLVTRHAVGLNPFTSVRGTQHTLVEGRTPEITLAQARHLLASIPLSRAAGLRDRALIGTLAYTGARVGAVSALRLLDFQEHEHGRELRFSEKGGKKRTIPVRYDLGQWIVAYIEAGGIAGDNENSPLFRSGLDRSGVLTVTGLTHHGIRKMLKRRLRKAGLPEIISPHSFRVFVVTDLLTQGVPIEDVQYLVGHASPRSTQLYDRRRRRVARNMVERISI